MAKVVVKNYAEHEFHLPGANGVGRINFPRLGTRVGSDGVPIETPGEIEVESSVVERMNKHPVTKSWLGSDARGRRQLVAEAVEEAPASKEAKK